MSAPTARSQGRRSAVNRAFLLFCLVVTSVSVVVLGVLLVSILVRGWDTLSWDFITSPVSTRAEDAGFAFALLGSLWLLAVCALTALPLGVGTAVLLEEFRPRRGALRWMHSVVQANIRNLAGVPSVVYGLIGLTIFARMFGVFGGPLQSDAFVEIETLDGERIIGVQLPAPPPELELVSDELGTVGVELQGASASFLEKLERDRSVEVAGTLMLDDRFRFTASLENAGEIRVDAFDVETELGLADPFEARPFAATLRLPDGATIDRQGGYRVMTVEAGEVFVSSDRIGDIRQNIDTVYIRTHRFELSSGETILGLIGNMDDQSITVEHADREKDTTIDRGEIERYSAERAFQVGDEDSPVFLRVPLGSSVLAGGLTLALVVLPIVIIASAEAVRSVPPSLRQGSRALGATRLQTVGGVVLPAAIPGIMTGSILAMSRAIGETAPILVVGAAAFVVSAPSSLMSDYTAMPLQIYQWTVLPEGRGFQSLAASGIVVLLAVLLAFNATAVLIRHKLEKRL